MNNAKSESDKLFPRISRKVSRLFPGNSPDLLQRVTVSARKNSQNGNSFVNLDSLRFLGIPQNFPEISQKFPEFSNIAFCKYFRYLLDNYKQRYIREPQGIPIWTPFGGPGAPQGPPKSNPRAFEW